LKDGSAKTLDLNPQFLKAIQIMEETDKNVFITGRAGTGKSTLLQYFRDNTKKEIAILAPTGVAAVNIKGQTIHSFFGFKPDITPDMVRDVYPRQRALYKKLDAIVIDEVSMVRADLMDCIDRFLRIYGKKKTMPFGGIQMIFIGDLYQLPPVVGSKDRELFRTIYKSPYFFDSMVFGSGFDMEFIELQKVYRQKDERFLNILNSIRNKTVSDEEIEVINTRYIPEFHDEKGFYIHLTTTNDIAESINMKRLSELKEREYKYQGFISGDFNKKDLPTGVEITLKIGAQVMLLNNDSLSRWINGTIGRIKDIERKKGEPDIIYVELQSGDVVDVMPHTWEMYEFHYDKRSKTITSDVVGTFTQYPIKLAWAITIHKGQGMTFEKVIIDIGRGTFSHGQLYVALSRCTTLEGIVIKKPISKKHILMDWRVVNFVTKYQYEQAKKTLSVAEKLSMVEKAIRDKTPLEIVYLKTKDEKSQRIIFPSFVGEIEYNGRKFIGIKAFCTKRKDDRVFHIERILQMRTVE